MVSPKILTKLNPKSPRFEIGLGGEQEITWEMVAAAKGNMPPMVSSYAEVAWNLDCPHNVKMALFIHFKIRIKQIIRKYWRNTGIETWEQMSEKLALLLIDEIENLDKRCKVCEGVGERRINNKVVQCQACKGFGKKLLSNRFRAQKVNLTIRAWQKTWETRYSNYLLPIISDLNYQMIKVLNKQLK